MKPKEKKKTVLLRNSKLASELYCLGIGVHQGKNGEGGKNERW